MMYWTSSFVIILALLCYEQTLADDVYQSGFKYEPKYEVRLDDYSFTKDNLLSESCIVDASYLGDQPEKPQTCQIVQRNFSYNNNVTLKCDIAMHIDFLTFHETYKLLSFGKNRALVTFADNSSRDKVHFVAINMTNCTNITKTVDSHGGLSMKDVIDQRSFAIYENSLDVFFKDESKCGGRMSKLTIDFNSNTSSYDPVVFAASAGSLYVMRNVVPVSNSPDRGVIYEVIDGTGESTSYLTLKNGLEKRLKFATQMEFRVPTATSDNSIVLCTRQMEDGHVHCLIHDLEGRIKDNVGIRVATDNLQMPSVLALPDGGFVLLVIKFENCRFNRECTLLSGVVAMRYVVKVDAYGRVKQYQFKDIGHGMGGMRYWNLWRNDETGKYCATEAIHDTDKRLMYFYSVCLADSDFK